MSCNIARLNLLAPIDFWKNSISFQQTLAILRGDFKNEKECQNKENHKNKETKKEKTQKIKKSPKMKMTRMMEITIKMKKAKK